MNFEIRLNPKLINDIETVFNQLQTNPAEYMPNTVNEFNQFTNEVADRLRNYFLGKETLEGTEPIPEQYKKSVGKLASSVNVLEKGPLSTTITADNPLIDKIQNGQAESEFDMKTKYPFGKHSRVSRDKKGNVKSNYLIICFRWGAKGETAHFSNNIPVEIYNTQTSHLTRSWRTGNQHLEENSRGEMVPRDEYHWGTRIDEKNAYAVEKSQVWKGREFTTRISNSGMVRMLNDDGKTNFVTFRVISTLSPKDSWIRRRNAIPPVDIQSGFERTIEKQRNTLEKNLAIAAQSDLLNLVSNLGE